MSDKSTMVVCLDDLIGETHYWAKQSAWSLEEHDKQIKTDAIEEFVSKCKEKIEEICLEREDDLTFLDIFDIEKIAEQLKSQDSME